MLGGASLDVLPGHAPEGATSHCSVVEDPDKDNLAKPGQPTKP